MAASWVEIGPATNELLARVAQTYRILFTRALKEVQVWVPDAEPRTLAAAIVQQPITQELSSEALATVSHR